MKGFTVLGKNVEPCFQGAAFFSENESRFDRFSLLLERVREAESKEGGKKDMEENEVKQVENFEEEEKVEVEVAVESEIKVDEPVVEEEETPAIDFAAEYEKMKQSFEEMELKFANVETELKEANEKIAAHQSEMDSARADFEKTLNEMNERLEAANQKIAEYEAQIKAIEDAKKKVLIDSYAGNLDSDEIEPIQANVENYSYNELEKELAVVFARKNLNKDKGEEKKERIPLVQEENSLAKLMAKYKK